MFSYTKYIAQTAKMPTFDRFATFVTDNQKNITPKTFAQDFNYMQRHFAVNKQARSSFCISANELADKLTQQKNYDFAGIIMSTLCKMAECFPEKLEAFAKKGYNIAKSNGDYIHMMARLNDLRKIYQNRYETLYEYVQVLYKQEKCLKELTNHYDNSVKNFHTLERKASRRGDYEQMLAFVQTEIGKLTRKKHPLDAQAKLLNARRIFTNCGNRQSVNYINMLLAKIENKL